MKCGIVGSMILSLGVVGLCFADQKIESVRYGFSEAARLETRDPFDFTLSFAFNEYMAMQDSMEIGYVATKETIHYENDIVADGHVLSFGFRYRPGFQVGLSLNTSWDKWNLGMNYLWYQGDADVRRSEDVPFYLSSPVFNIEPFEFSFTTLKADWDLNLSLVDLYLTRPYFSGRKLIVKPLFGLRGSGIREHFSLNASVAEEDIGSEHASTKVNSWGIGPKLGSEMNYILGKGFSLVGTCFTSLLYTNYTKAHLKYSNSIGEKSFLSESRYGALRPIFDGSMGVNWRGYFGLGSGVYSWHKTFYLNVQATYNFLLFFSQNIGRSLVSFASDTQTVPGNLYLQGISLGVSIVF